MQGFRKCWGRWGSGTGSAGVCNEHVRNVDDEIEVTGFMVSSLGSSFQRRLGSSRKVLRAAAQTSCGKKYIDYMVYGFQHWAPMPVPLISGSHCNIARTSKCEDARWVMVGTYKASGPSLEHKNTDLKISH